ncbi:MAG: hypothetical protein R2722_17930 [Tessaracoccus sp.]
MLPSTPTEWEQLPEPELLKLMWQGRKLLADRMTGMAAMLTATVERRNAAILVTRTPLNTLIAQTEHRDGKDANRAVFQGRDLTRNAAVSKAVLEAHDLHRSRSRCRQGDGRASAGRHPGPSGADHWAAGDADATASTPSELCQGQRGPAAGCTRARCPARTTKTANSPNNAASRYAAAPSPTVTTAKAQPGSVVSSHLEAEPLINTTRIVANTKRAEHDRPAGTPAPEITREQRYADALTRLRPTA